MYIVNKNQHNEKNYFFLFVFPLASYGQQAQGQAQAQAQSTQVTVESKTVNKVDYNLGIAAKAAAMSEPFNEVITPLTVDLYDYTHIALVTATCENLKYYGLVAKSLSYSALTVINPRKYNRKKYRKNPTYLRTEKNPNWVYVTYTMSTQGLDDIRSLTIRDSQNKILYKAKTRNVSFEEVLSVLTDI